MAKTEETDNDEKNNNNESTTHPANFRESAAFRRASFHPPEEIWNIFSEAEECRDVIDYFRAMVNTLNIDPNLHGKAFYDILTSKLTTWKCQSLWDLLNIKLKQNEYKQGQIGKDTKCLIIGAGPIGLRTAIEFLALGCKTVIVEKRKEFTRNNVLHLWPFLMTDFRELGAKKFYGKFGAGSIDHINIKTLQCILLKVALVLGLEIHVGVEFASLVEPTEENNVWRAVYKPENHPVSKYSFDVVIGADGKKNILPGFKQIELRGALAIGITCNFVNNNTLEEAKVPEISGVSFQFNPNFFKNMEEKYGVRLENIVYYKNETHYFVMTALKPSLIKCGVIKEDFSEPGKLLQSSNIDREKLIDYTLKAVNFSTNHILPDLQFKLLSNGNPDIALFDFTSIKKAANAARIIERHGQKLFLALVGDSLIEPFWPTGSGCGRGVLSALDVAWSVRQFSLKHPPLSILRERENVFKLLSGTSNDSLQKNYKAYTINPFTRYTAFDAKKVSNMASLKGLYDTDDIENANMTISSPTAPDSPKKVLRKRRSSGSTTPRKQHVTSSHIHQHTTPQAKTPKRRSAGVLKEQISVGNTKAFWEEHNKKNFEERSKEQVKKKEEDTVDEDDEEDDEDDVEIIDDDSDIVEEKPVVKKGFSQQKSKDHKLKRQSSRDTLSPTEDQQPAVKKKIFVGLKHLKQEEKEEKKPKRKSLSKSKKRNDSSSGKSESLTKDKGAKKRESLEKKKKKSESSDVATCELPEEKDPPRYVCNNGKNFIERNKLAVKRTSGIERRITRKRSVLQNTVERSESVRRTTSFKRKQQLLLKTSRNTSIIRRKSKITRKRLSRESTSPLTAKKRKSLKNADQEDDVEDISETFTEVSSLPEQQSEAVIETSVRSEADSLPYRSRALSESKTPRKPTPVARSFSVDSSNDHPYKSHPSYMDPEMSWLESKDSLLSSKKDQSCSRSFDDHSNQIPSVNLSQTVDETKDESLSFQSIEQSSSRFLDGESNAFCQSMDQSTSQFQDCSSISSKKRRSKIPIKNAISEEVEDTIDYGYKPRLQSKRGRFCPLGTTNRLAVPGAIRRTRIPRYSGESSIAETTTNASLPPQAPRRAGSSLKRHRTIKKRSSLIRR